jgi:hypothetical protein
MNDHNIELEELFNSTENYLKSSLATTENKETILNTLAFIYAKETRKNPIPTNSNKKRVIVDSREEYYPFLLSVYLLINDVKKLFEILDFNRNNFRSNRLVEDAKFDVFLNTYVWESIKINRVNLNISDVDFEVFSISWEDYFTKSRTNELSKINFKLDDEFKKLLINGISAYVIKEDHFLLNDFFSKNEIKNCVRFTVPANAVADLFFRLHKHKKIEQSCSKSNIANWLAGRIMTKGASQKFYLNPKSEPLKNILLRKKGSALKLLPDILP